MAEATKFKPEFKWLARMGYLSRGVVYLVVGGLAIMAALGSGGGTTDSRGALQTIANQPFGNVLLALMVVGLLGYSIWRSFQSLKDTDDHGTSGKGLVIRGGLLTSAVTHFALAIWAINLLLGGGGGSSGQTQAEGWLSSQGGQIVLGLLGVAVIGAGLAHLYKGWTARFEKYMHFPPGRRRWAKPVCQFGLMARGVVWCIVGWFFIDSALTAGQENLRGISDALGALRNTAYGPWLFVVVAAGLFAFGLYSCLEAFYRKIDLAEDPP